MSFDVDAFMGQKYSPAEEDIPVPDLKAFFGGDEEPVWTVRGLTANEIAKARDASKTEAKVEAIVKAITSEDKRGQVDAIRKHLGLDNDVHDDIRVRLKQLVFGSVAPEITDAMAVKLASVAPVIFYELTNKINVLTGQGQIPGKPKPSGNKTTSE